MPVKIIKKGVQKKGLPSRKPRQTWVTNWPALKETYISRNLHPKHGEMYTLRDLAKEFGLDYFNVRNRSHLDKWGPALKQAIADRDVRVRELINEYRAKVLIGAQEGSLEEEIEVRKRQSAIARVMYEVGFLRITSIDPMAFTPKEAIELVRLGLQEERRSLGVPDKYEVYASDTPSDFMSVQRAKTVLKRVIEMAKNATGQYEKRVEKSA
ncbi:MAG: hypothetical protein ACWGQW_02010 [bacterium]